jgi:hypothetical protein
MLTSSNASLLATLLLCNACSLFESPAKAKDDDTKSTTVAESGSERVELQAGRESTVRANADGKLAGTKLDIPAGSLAIDTEIEIEQGSSLVNDSDVKRISALRSAQITGKGTPVLISSSEAFDPELPLTLQIPAPSSSSTGLVATSYVAVLAKYVSAEDDGNVFVTIIEDVEVVGDVVVFEIDHFGVFQAIETTAPVVSDEEILAMTPISSEAADDILTGMWDEGCRAKAKTATVEAEVTHNFATFTNEIFGMHVRIFDVNDTTCAQSALAEFALLGSYSIGGQSSTLSDGSNVDIGITRILLRPLSKDIVKAFNDSKECDRTDWSTEDVFDLTDKFGKANCLYQEKDSETGCAKSNASLPNSTIFQTLQVENDKLTFGNEFGNDCTTYGTSADKRPIAWESKSYSRVTN